MKNTQINLNFINILKGMSFSQMFVIYSIKIFSYKINDQLL